MDVCPVSECLLLRCVNRWNRYFEGAVRGNRAGADIDRYVKNEYTVFSIVKKKADK